MGFLITEFLFCILGGSIEYVSGTSLYSTTIFTLRDREIGNDQSIPSKKNLQIILQFYILGH